MQTAKPKRHPVIAQMYLDLCELGCKHARRAVIQQRYERFFKPGRSLELESIELIPVVPRLDPVADIWRRITARPRR